MAQPEQRCRHHSRSASFVNVKNGDLLCDLDEVLWRGSPLHESLRPIAEVDLRSLRPRPPEPVTHGLPPLVRPSSQLWTQACALSLHVSYAQVYLRDADPSFFQPEFARGGVGLISGQVGCAALITGLHTGHVGFTVVIATEDPGPDLSYEDIVEADFEARTSDLALVEWGGMGAHRLPELPPGPGNYRLRYHGRNLDAAHAGGVVMADEPVVDTYLLQLWPAPATPPAILKVTSQHAAYWQSIG